MITGRAFRIEGADVRDYQMFADIIQTVWNGLDRKDWFVADNAEYTYEMLGSGRGIGYKAVDMDTGETAGVFMATIPGMGQENLGRDAGLADGELSLVAHSDTAKVPGTQTSISPDADSGGRSESKGI